jgi:hypothetical protein
LNIKAISLIDVNRNEAGLFSKKIILLYDLIGNEDRQLHYHSKVRSYFLHIILIGILYLCVYAELFDKQIQLENMLNCAKLKYLLSTSYPNFNILIERSEFLIVLHC